MYSVFCLFTDVEAGESYRISVSPVYKQQCGAPQSLAASLQQGGRRWDDGAADEMPHAAVLDADRITRSLTWTCVFSALMEVDQLRVSAVSKTTVTAAWAWQRKAAPVRVNIYRVMLWSSSEKHSR